MMYNLASHVHLQISYDMPALDFMYLYSIYKKDQIKLETETAARNAAGKVNRIGR